MARSPFTTIRLELEMAFAARPSRTIIIHWIKRN